MVCAASCLPCDASSDCHVVDIVYVSSLGRWIFLDPSYEAWFTDEKGNLPGLSDIRARMIAGERLILNPEANCNGGPLDCDYLHYLSKNLYRFEAPLHHKKEATTFDGCPLPSGLFLPRLCLSVFLFIMQKTPPLAEVFYSRAGCDSKDGSPRTYVLLNPRGYKAGPNPFNPDRLIVTGNPEYFWRTP